MRNRRARAGRCVNRIDCRSMARTEATCRSPSVESRRWTEGGTFPPSRPLINVSQAAPADPPPTGLRQAIADAALNETDAHLYGAVLGRSELRAALAAQISEHYDGTVGAAPVGITPGCHPALAAALAAQFSAAIADTGGCGGLVHELTNEKVPTRHSYVLVAGLGIALTWFADVFESISYASRAFALYYALQSAQAALSAWRLEIAYLRTGFFAALSLLGFAIPRVGQAAE